MAIQHQRWTILAIVWAIVVIPAAIWFVIGQDAGFRYRHPQTTVGVTFIPPVAFSALLLAVSPIAANRQRFFVFSHLPRAIKYSFVVGFLYSAPLLVKWWTPAFAGLIGYPVTRDDVVNFLFSFCVLTVVFSLMGAAVGGVVGVIRSLFLKSDAGLSAN